MSSEVYFSFNTGKILRRFKIQKIQKKILNILNILNQLHTSDANLRVNQAKLYERLHRIICNLPLIC